MDLESQKMELLQNLEKEPLNANTLNQLACVLIEQCDFEGALSILKKAASYKPTIQILNNLAYIYIHDGDLIDGEWINAEDNAMKIIEQVIQLNPTSHFPYSLLGEAYLNKGRYSEAKDILEKAINIKGTVGNYNNLGIALYKNGRYKEAAECFLKAHSLQNEADYSFQPYLSYCICLALIDRKAEAESVAEYLLSSKEVKSKGSVDIIDIAKVYFYTESYLKAVELFKAAFEEYIVSTTDFGMYEFALVQLNMLETADEFYNKSVSYNKECIDDIANDVEVDEDNKNERIKFLMSEIEQYETVYRQIRNGVKPSSVFEPQVEEECYLFGCIRHNNPYYIAD